MDATALPPQARAAIDGSPWCLRFLNGALRGRTLALRHGPNRAGSSGDCELMLPASDALAQHLVFEVGALTVTLQCVGAADALLNGEPMPTSRRSLAAGDVVRVGAIELQLDQMPAAAPPQDPMFAAAGEAVADPPGRRTRGPASGARKLRLGVGAAVAALGIVIVALFGLSRGGAPQALGAGARTDLAEVQRVLSPFTDVEAVAGTDAIVSVRGFVGSPRQRQDLQRALAPFGAGVELRVVSAEELVAQARQFVSDPGVSITYEGKGRLVLAGTAEGESVRRQIRRLGDDLFPLVRVSDKVSYPTRSPAGDHGARDAATRTSWAAWQDLLPARIVGITEGANGLSHIQLANGSRYYEGSVLRSGTELKSIDVHGLVLKEGGPAKAAD